jgi:uncharacterized protein YndB with AHSA1/START domain
MTDIVFDPNLDLMLDRVVAVPRALLWRCWTEPDLFQQWYVPAPWGLAACTLDLRPGGAFETTMRSPEGQEFPNKGCYLDVVPLVRVVWTDALQAGYRPAERGYLTDEGFYVTVHLQLDDVAGGTRYRTWAMHSSPTGQTKHREMGFDEGWGAAADQLVALCQRLMT